MKRFAAAQAASALAGRLEPSSTRWQVNGDLLVEVSLHREQQEGREGLNGWGRVDRWEGGQNRMVTKARIG